MTLAKRGSYTHMMKAQRVRSAVILAASLAVGLTTALRAQPNQHSLYVSAVTKSGSAERMN